MKHCLQETSPESSSDAFMVSSDADDEDDEERVQNEAQFGDQEVVHVDDMAFDRFFQFMRETNLMMANIGAGDVVFDLEDDSDDDFEEL